MPLFRRAALAGLMIAGLAAPAPAATPPSDAPPVIGADVESFTLANGLEVVVIPDRRAPVATHMLWYKVGAADEPPGKSGIAHYLEHLMFKGTKTRKPGEYSGIVARLGGQENAFTSSDYTGYFQRVAKEHLPTVMALEADRMTNLVLTEALAEPELRVVLEERGQRTDSDPSALLGEAVDATLYQSHPYGLPIIGWRHEIEGLTWRDAIDFYERWYTPDNAVLVVAGDVDTAEVRRLAEATYGKIARRGTTPARLRPQEPPALAERVVSLTDERVAQPNLRITWVVPSATTGKPGEAEALDVLTDVLGEGSSSRLYRALVVEKGLASSAGGWYQSTGLDDTRLTLYATPRDGVTLEALRVAMLEVLADIARQGPTTDEIARAKRKVVADAIYAQDSQQTLARLFGTALTTGATIDMVKNWPARIAAVSAEDVTRAARTYLTPARSVTGYLRQAPGAVAPAAGAPAKPEPAGPAAR